MVDNRKTLCYSITRNKIKQAKSPKEKIDLTNELTLLTKENFGGNELDSYRNEGLKLVKTEKFAGLDVDFYKDENNNIYMTRNQIGTALEYSNPRLAINKIHMRNQERLDKFSTSTTLVLPDGKSREATFYNEKGIYEIMRKSNQPKADEFYDFVYEVIEGLRKGELQIKATPQTYIEALRALADAEEEKEKLSQEVVGLTHTIGLMEPKVKYLDTILTSTDALNVTQIAKDYGLSGRKLNQLLSEEHIQYKTGGQWVLYQKYAGEGYTKTHTHLFDKPDGSTGTNLQTKWTQKGRLLIHNILTSKGYVAEMDKMGEEEN